MARHLDKFHLHSSNLNLDFKFFSFLIFLDPVFIKYIIIYWYDLNQNYGHKIYLKFSSLKARQFDLLLHMEVKHKELNLSC